MFGGDNDNAWWSGIQDMLFLLYHRERITSSDVSLGILIYNDDDDFYFIPMI